MANTAVAQRQPASPVMFRERTRPNSVPCGSTNFNAWGMAPSTINVPHAGWLARLFIYWAGSYTTGAGSPTGSFSTYPPPPYNFIRQIRVLTNTQTEIVRLSGYGLYIFNRYYRRTNFPDADLDTDYNSGNRAALLSFPTGTPAASTVYPVSGWLEIPIVTDDALGLGMLFLQSDQVTLQVEITPASQTDAAGNIAGVSVTPNVTVYAQALFMEQPPDLSIRPNVQYVHMLREEQRNVPGTGNQVWPLPLGNTYLKVFGQFENNAAQLASTALSNLGLQYAQTVTPFNESGAMHAAINKAYLGNAIPDGAFLFDFSRGSGIPGLYEGRDFLNSAQVTDLELMATIATGTTLTNPNLRLMSEQLQAIGGP